MLSNPKTLAILIIAVIAFVVSLLGGALGSAFGFGFLSAPLAHIQLPAEPVLAGYILPGWKLMNTMIAAWLAIVILIVISFLATRRMQEVPTGLQNLVEVFIEFFLGMCERIAGAERARRFFPLVMTIFLFIMVANWTGILPGFGTIGRIESPEEYIHHVEDKLPEGEQVDLHDIHLQVFEGDGGFGYLGFGSLGNDITAHEYEETHSAGEGKQAGILVPFLRSANTDVNMTLAIALISMVTIHIWGLSALGFGHVGKFINFKEGPVGLFVGILEAIGEVAKIISFTFRLFGNMFAGEVLLFAMAFLFPLIGIVPFLGLELFVGAIQAFIFAMLTLVFAVMATTAHGGEHH
ncbi:MAG: F0F1 ATP synthase subunit A [Chloroflexota bacterium]|nr:F0F1 ATP synthase subunit A [Chloroflexota bacterium]MCY3637950.1 F0F1 ATP synthase subunit A [Chloroflexota bacterium]MDE2686798.1 F0F1 ATP synthase subunit A [Chloroflexota bacterium]